MCKAEQNKYFTYEWDNKKEEWNTKYNFNSEKSNNILWEIFLTELFIAIFSIFEISK